MAEAGHTSAHSAQAVHLSSKTSSGEGEPRGAGLIAFSGHVFMQAPQPRQASVTSKTRLTGYTPGASPCGHP